jgi:hypothetical protein
MQMSEKRKTGSFATGRAYGRNICLSSVRMSSGGSDEDLSKAFEEVQPHPVVVATKSSCQNYDESKALDFLFASDFFSLYLLMHGVGRV